MPIHFQWMPRFAELLEYPGPGIQEKAARLADSLTGYTEIWEDLVEAFALHVRLTPLSELEETYTRVFDMNPSCTLEIGWHLFGENYKRGSFLVNLREQLRRHGIAEGSSLPDFLPSLLRLLPCLQKEDAKGLVVDCILPALDKIRPKLREGADPYNHLLEALEMLLKEPGRPTSEHACNGHEVNHAD